MYFKGTINKKRSSLKRKRQKENGRAYQSTVDRRGRDKRIQEIGEQISKDYVGKQVHLVCVLGRVAAFFHV